MEYSYDEIKNIILKYLREDGEKPLLIAIDGNCAAGKSTLASRLQNDLGGNIFHMDDYFLQKYQRTGERLSEIGGNVDYERFKKEVIEPLKKGEAVKVYSCIHPDFILEYRKTLEYKKLNIIEGSYSCHPYFGFPYKIQIFVGADYELQIERIRRRNGEVMLQRFINEWIPKENDYFRKMQIKEKCLQIKMKN